MNTIARYARLWISLLSLAGLLTACATPTPTPKAIAPAKLRVGLSPDLPPLVFLENNQLTGLEVDLARELAHALGRPVEVSTMPWKGLLKALQTDQIDVIMGGITITPARSLQVAFTEPILESGLMALIRASDRETLGTAAALASYGGQIGVIAGTTSDAFVQRAYPRARRIAVDTAPDAALILQRRGIDAFVYDLPTIIWMHSRNEAATALIKEPLQREQLGWAVRRDDEQLKNAINDVLAGWKKDGTLQKAIDRWLPYYQKLVDQKP